MCPSQNGDSFRLKKISNKLKVLCFPKIGSDCNAEIWIRFLNFIKNLKNRKCCVFKKKQVIQKWSRKCSILGHRNDPSNDPKMTPWGDPKIVDFWSDVATMYGTQDCDIAILYPYGLELVKAGSRLSEFDILAPKTLEKSRLTELVSLEFSFNGKSNVWKQTKIPLKWNPA